MSAWKRAGAVGVRRTAHSVWLLWCLLVAADARPPPRTPGFRHLVQQLQQDTPLSCPIANCAPDGGCVVGADGTRCPRCAAGFASYNRGEACYCKAGSYMSADQSCVLCQLGYYCPFATDPVLCPNNLTTARMGAKSLNDCVNPPGYKYVPNNGNPILAPCEADRYTMGLRKQVSCNRCPSGFSTDPSNAPGTHTSSRICLAGPGFVFLGSTVAPCEVGTFKPGWSATYEPCIPCAAVKGPGIITDGTGSTSPDDCYVVKPGYAALGVYGSILRMKVSASNQVTNALPCPQGFYCPGGNPVDGIGLPDAGVPVMCPTNMLTRRQGARLAAECLAPPGFYFDAATSSALECPDGHYKTGWDRAPACIACGAGGWRSQATVTLKLLDGISPAGRTLKVKGAASSCYLQPGMGALVRNTQSGSSKVLTAFPCPAGFYSGHSRNLFGLKASWCIACPAGQVTTCPPGSDAPPASCNTTAFRNADAFPSQPDVGFYSRDACVHPAGYGWVTQRWSSSKTGEVTTWTSSAPCPLDSWSQGGNNASCEACPDTTVTAGTGSTSAAACVSASLSQGQRAVLVTTAGYESPGIFTSSDGGGSWAGSAASSGSWVAVTSSQQGKRLVAVSGSSDLDVRKIATSDDFGMSWIYRGETGVSNLKAVTSSLNGQVVVAAGTDQIHTSVDWGETWTPQNKAGAWVSLAASDDGGRVFAAQAGSDGKLVLGSRLGLTSLWSWTDLWDPMITGVPGDWAAVAADANLTLAAAVQSGPTGGILLGVRQSNGSWAFSPVNDTAVTGAGGSWQSVAMEPGGSRIVAAQSGPSGGLFTATANGDGTWSWAGPLFSPAGDWKEVAWSRAAGGSTLLGIKTLEAAVYKSTDSGATWTSISTAVGGWQAIAVSGNP